MSGGSYNYLYCKDVYFEGWGDIQEMIDRLKDLGSEPLTNQSV